VVVSSQTYSSEINSSLHFHKGCRLAVGSADEISAALGSFDDRLPFLAEWLV
jgi:hypothetical protein